MSKRGKSEGRKKSVSFVDADISSPSTRDSQIKSLVSQNNSSATTSKNGTKLQDFTREKYAVESEISRLQYAIKA